MSESHYWVSSNSPAVKLWDLSWSTCRYAPLSFSHEPRSISLMSSRALLRWVLLNHHSKSCLSSTAQPVSITPLYLTAILHYVLFLYFDFCTISIVFFIFSFCLLCMWQIKELELGFRLSGCVLTAGVVCILRGRPQTLLRAEIGPSTICFTQGPVPKTLRDFEPHFHDRTIERAASCLHMIWKNDVN